MALLTGFDEITPANSTFTDWLAKTNAMIVLMRDDVVTANSSYGTTNGHAEILGNFSANIVYTDTLSGGTLSGGAANLEIISEVLFSANAIFANNVNVYVTENLQVEGGLYPTTNAIASGSTTLRWDIWATDIDVSGNVDVTGDLLVVGNVSADAFTGNTIDIAFITGVGGELNINSNTTFDDAVGVTGDLSVTANCNVTQDISGNNIVANTLSVDSIAGTDSNSLTITTNTSITGNSNLIIEGDLTVNGTFNYSLTAFDDVIPTTTGSDLGNTSNRWDAFLANVEVSNTGYLYPQSNGGALGSANNRWDAYTTDIDADGEITTTGGINAANLYISGTANIGALEVTSLTTDQVAIIGNTANVTSNSGVIIDSFPATESYGVKYQIWANTGSEDSVYMLEILCAHSYGAGTPYMHYTRYGEISNDAEITLVPDLNGANVELTATCPSADGANAHYFKIMRLETI